MIEYLFCIFGVGYFIYYLLKNNIKLYAYEKVLYIFIYGLFSTYLMSFIFLMVEVYNVKFMEILIKGMGLLGIVLGIKNIFNSKVAHLLRNIKKKKMILVMLLISITSIVFVYNRPNENVLHDFLDASNYVNQAAYMNKTGKYYMTQEYKENIELRDKVANTNFETYYMKYKSVLMDGEENFEMPFYILNKIALANAMIFGGIVGSLYIPLVFLILIFGAIIVLAKKMIKNDYLCIFISLVLTLTPAIINNSRSTMSELITLLIIILFINHHIRKNEENIQTLDLNDYIISILFAMLFLVRSDALFILIGIVFAQNMSIGFKIERKKTCFLLILSFIMGMVSFLINPTYSNSTFDKFIFKDKNIYPYLLSTVVLIGLVFESIDIKKIFKFICFEKFNSLFLKIMLPIYFTFCFVIRPILNIFIGQVDTSKTNGLINLYPGLCIFAYFGIITFGICLFVFNKVSQKEKNGVIVWALFCFLPASIVLAYDFMHSTHLYWASRRYIYSLFPLFIITVIYLLKYIRNIKKIVFILGVLLVQNLILNYNGGRINDLDKIYYIGITDSLLQLDNQLKADKVAIYYDIQDALPLVNYINNFTNKEAILVYDDTIKDVLKDGEHDVIVEDLEEILANQYIQSPYSVDYFMLKYSHKMNSTKKTHSKQYMILRNDSVDDSTIISQVSISERLLGYVDNIYKVNEDVYYMQGWTHWENKNIEELVVTDGNGKVIAKTVLGEERLGINEAINTSGAKYSGWNILFFKPETMQIKIFVSIEGEYTLFKELSLE